MTRPVVKKSFFNRPAPVVARGLLGKYLVCGRPGKDIALPVVETEAYDGFEDRASHASRGETRANAAMFGPGGRYYVYLCYGMHWMLNVVTGPPGYPAAVLIRGAGTVLGPGRLTRLLGIDRGLNGRACVPESGLWFENREGRVPDARVERTARIGVSYAGEEWAAKPLRFILKTAKGGA
jgi:DNA-3-methyladenine glycosylase